MTELSYFYIKIVNLIYFYIKYTKHVDLLYNISQLYKNL